jgi:hypothetical protein
MGFFEEMLKNELCCLPEIYEKLPSVVGLHRRPTALSPVATATPIAGKF